MSASIKENIPPQVDSKTSKKKKAKGGVSTPASVVPTQSQEDTKDQSQVNGVDGGSESTYLKEISKNIRNLKKKITASTKVETILAEHQGKTVDDLLASRVINADQKAQLEKKPGLVAQLDQYESQYEQYKKLDEEYQHKISSEKESLLAAHVEEIEKLKSSVRSEVEEENKTMFTQKLLTLSRFLRTAAAKRSDEDNEADDNAAFEGALLLVYGGDMNAVNAMEKLIDGSDEIVPGVDGEQTGFNYKHVRDASQASEPTVADESVETSAAPQQIGSDPTVVNAGLTEIEDTTSAVNGDAPVTEPISAPDAGLVDGSANAVAEAAWDSKMSQSMTSGPDGFEIVEHPRDPAETDNGLDATPAAITGATGTQSWAEDVPTEAPIIPSAVAPVDDGFHQVSHHRNDRGRGRGGGEFRGRGRGGRGGEGRGRGRGGFRGDGRGRGRGGGDRGGRDRGRGASS